MDDVRILIIDDDDDFRQMLVKRLNTANMNTQGIKDTASALKSLKQKEFDVIILEDLELLKQIKADTPGTQVIILTRQTSVDFGIAAMKLGAFDCVIKPAIMNELLDKIRQACENSRIRKDPAVFD
ncbi:MAG: response regulator [Pseudomonadota bacterium]